MIPHAMRMHALSETTRLLDRIAQRLESASPPSRLARVRRKMGIPPIRTADQIMDHIEGVVMSAPGMTDLDPGRAQNAVMVRWNKAEEMWNKIAELV